MAVLAGRIRAEITVFRFREVSLPECDHLRIDLENVDRMGIIHHVGIMPARGAHVYLHHGIVARLADAGIVLCQPDELKVDKAPVHAEGFYRPPSQLEQLRRNFGRCVKMNVLIFLHRVDDRGVGAHGFKQRLTVRADHGVIGADIPVQEFLHDIGHGRKLPVKRGQVLFRFQLHRTVCPNPDIRLYDHGVAHLRGKRPAGSKVRDDMLARRGDARLQENLLHFRLSYQDADPVLSGAERNVEVRAEPRVRGKPVFIQRLQPVRPPVMVHEIRHRMVYLLIVFQRLHIIVFREGGFQLIVQAVIRHIPDPEHVYAQFAQTVAEMGAGDGIRR